MVRTFLVLWIGLLAFSASISGQHNVSSDSIISKQYITVSSALITTGVILNKDDLKRGFRDWVRDRIDVPTYTVDDIIQHVPIVTVIASDLMLGRSKEERMRHIRHLLVAEGTALGTMFLIKLITDTERPNGARFAFPSGHTTYSFASAGVLYHSLKEEYPFWAYSGYAMATFVGASRILRDKHWVSDVLVGAGLGLLSSHLTYQLDIWDSRGDTVSSDHLTSSASLGLTPLGISLTVQF